MTLQDILSFLPSFLLYVKIYTHFYIKPRVLESNQTWSTSKPKSLQIIACFCLNKFCASSSQQQQKIVSCVKVKGVVIPRSAGGLTETVAKISQENIKPRAYVSPHVRILRRHTIVYSLSGVKIDSSYS